MWKSYLPGIAKAEVPTTFASCLRTIRIKLYTKVTNRCDYFEIYRKNIKKYKVSLATSNGIRFVLPTFYSSIPILSVANGFANTMHQQKRVQFSTLNLSI